MTTEEATTFLFELEKFGMKMDLQNISKLMEYSGNPHKNLRAIHVAGTNGKGSTCAAIASVLTSMKYKTGLYTSPHILNFTERIKIDGEQISEADVAHLTEFFRPEIIRLRATFFEATTAMMFKYFADSKVDYAVIETGLGGRLDSTNIVDPLVSVITSIGLDHTDILGDTPEKIAYEKAGIIKECVPVIVNCTTDPVKKVFRSVAAQKDSPLFFVDEKTTVRNLEMTIDGSIFDAMVFDEAYHELKVEMIGHHQVENAMTALTTLSVLGRHGVNLDKENIYEGFENIRENTGHRGRMEILSHDPLVILDVAHNPAGTEALMQTLDLIGDRAGVLLFGAMRDKDTKSMLNLLRQKFEKVILTQLQTQRSLSASELKILSEDINLQSQVFNNSSEALRAALNQINNAQMDPFGKSFLLVTGSHYLAGEILPAMDKVSSNLQ